MKALAPFLKICKLVGRQRNKCTAEVCDLAGMECFVGNTDRDMAMGFPGVQGTGSVVVSRALDSGG